MPKLEIPPATIFEYLVSRFPHIDAEVWRSRIRRGLVTFGDGTALNENSSYHHGQFLFYRREIANEPPPLAAAGIVYRDDEILVADKPNGMPVTPAGPYVERSLLAQLQKSTGLADLAPVHRLDRDTAGLVLFTIRRETRGRYHGLFAKGNIERQYLAIAPIQNASAHQRWHIENRIEPGEPWFRQHIVAGPVNAITDIELIRIEAPFGLFRLIPKTGRKHQLRVHMASIGFAIAGDPYYPDLKQRQEDDPALQLLANRLEFTDPLTGARRVFVSRGRYLDAAARLSTTILPPLTTTRVLSIS